MISSVRMHLRSCTNWAWPEDRQELFESHNPVPAVYLDIVQAITIICRMWEFILHKNLWHLIFILKLSCKELDLVENMMAPLWNFSHMSPPKEAGTFGEKPKRWTVPSSGNTGQRFPQWAAGTYSVTAWVGQWGSSHHSSPCAKEPTVLGQSTAASTQTFHQKNKMWSSQACQERIGIINSSAWSLTPRPYNSEMTQSE